MPDTKWYKSIGFKIILSVAAAAILVNAIFGYLSLEIQKRTLTDTLLQSAVRNSETIRKSIRFDMLENRKENAYRIMDTIGEQEGIEKVRIYASDGRIIFSTDKAELGGMVDKKAEACTACHAEEESAPRKDLAQSDRSRIFRSPSGRRVIGMISPIHNEPDCSSPRCHPSPDAQKILGVIDITMSLREADAAIAQARNQAVLFGVLSILTVSWLVVVLMMRFVGGPVRALVVGTNKVAGGDLDHAIPIATDDEMGQLARSFNHMTERLKTHEDEIRSVVHSLEEKFQEKTEQLKEAQAHLLHAEKLAVLGRIAATVAHEINNPLTGVYTYIKLMERKIGDVAAGNDHLGKFREYLATMGKEVQRTSAIVLNLLDFSRPKDPIRTAADINRLIDETVALIGNRLKMNSIDIHRDLGPLPDLLVDPAQIKQVFINILVNACEAMEGGGRVDVVSRYDDARKAAVIEFVDTGPGIPREILPRIFDPFFTTKDKGTGLGLSVAHGIVTRHNGNLVVESAPGAGTVMRVTLPHT